MCAVGFNESSSENLSKNFANDSKCTDLLELMHNVQTWHVFPQARTLLFFTWHAEYVACIISLAINVFLIASTQMERSNTLRVYTRVIVQTCMIDLLFSLTGLSIKVFSELIGVGVLFTLVDHRGVTIPPSWRAIAFGWRVFTWQIMIYSLFFIFYFRYSIVVRKIPPSTSRLNVMLLMAIVLSLITGYDFSDVGNYRMLCERFLPAKMETDFDFGECFIVRKGYLLGLSYPISNIIQLVMCLVVIYYTFEVRRVFEKMRHLLEKNAANIHGQINRALMLQLIMPIICAPLPNTIGFITRAYGVHVPGLGAVWFLLLHWLPVVNPAITFALVPNYRRNIVRLVANARTRMSSSYNSSQVVSIT